MRVAGFLTGTIGLGEGARRQLQLLDALAAEERLPATVQGIDLTKALIPDRDTIALNRQRSTAASAAGGCTIFHVNPPELPQALAASRISSDTYRIGYWVYELEVAPKRWRIANRLVNEVWAPSRFAANALEATLNRPVHVMPFPLSLAEPAAGGRAMFGIGSSDFLALCTYDVKSSQVRKNPEGAIAAFRSGLAGRKDARLVVKVSNLASWTPAQASLAAAIDGDERIKIVTDALDQAAMAGLVEEADVVLSLHRSEGYGLLLAEAMARAKPVIATNWSGNTDYMTADNALLVSARLVPVVDPQGNYSGGRWAEPDLEQAAKHVAECYSNPSMRGSLGQRAQTSIQLQFGVGLEDKYRRRLAELQLPSAHASS